MGEGKTRVTLEHKNLDRYGKDMEKVKSSVGSEEGWSGIMKLYAAVAEGDMEYYKKETRRNAEEMAE